MGFVCVCVHFVYLFFVVVLFSNCFLKKKQKCIELGRWGGREVLGDEGEIVVRTYYMKNFIFNKNFKRFWY